MAQWLWILVALAKVLNPVLAPSQLLTAMCNSSSRELMLSSSLHGYQTCIWIHTYMQANSHKIKISKSWGEGLNPLLHS